MQGTSGISGWSGHGHASGSDRSKDHYDAGVYLNNLNLTDDEILTLIGDSIMNGTVNFTPSPNQTISKKDNKPINFQKELNILMTYSRTKASTLTNMADAIRILSGRR